MNASMQNESTTIDTSSLIKTHRAFSVASCLMYVLFRSDIGGLPPTLHEFFNNSLVHGSVVWTMFVADLVGLWFGRRYSSQQSGKRLSELFSGEAFRLANFRPYLLVPAFVAAFELVVVIFRLRS